MYQRKNIKGQEIEIEVINLEEFLGMSLSELDLDLLHESFR